MDCENAKHPGSGITLLPSKSRAKVYVVDDDAAVRDSLAAMIESYGFDIEAYPSGKEFLNKVPPNARGCLLLDLHLPIIGGLEVLSKMRARGQTLAVILITGGGSDRGLVDRAQSFGALTVMDKPLDHKQLIANLTRIHDGR